MRLQHIEDYGTGIHPGPQVLVALPSRLVQVLTPVLALSVDRAERL